MAPSKGQKSLVPMTLLRSSFSKTTQLMDRQLHPFTTKYGTLPPHPQGHDCLQHPPLHLTELVSLLEKLRGNRAQVYVTPRLKQPSPLSPQARATSASSLLIAEGIGAYLS